VDRENSLCCNKHRAGALALDPVEVHSTFDSACGMPDSVWLRVERRCVMDLLDDEPVPAACEKETV
jgi:hypothetical protein